MQNSNVSWKKQLIWKNSFKKINKNNKNNSNKKLNKSFNFLNYLQQN